MEDHETTVERNTICVDFIDVLNQELKTFGLLLY